MFDMAVFIIQRGFFLEKTLLIVAVIKDLECHDAEASSQVLAKAG